MAKNTQNTSIFKKILAIGLAVVLACGLAAGVCSMGFASRNDDGKWFGNFSNLSTWHWSDKIGNVGDVPENPDNPDNPSTGDTVTAGGAIISDIKSAGGVSLLSAVLPREAYSANGIDTHAETAFTLNATITPANADDKRVEWTVTDTSGSINASDYITLNANGLTATIACKQAFDRQLTVTVKSLDNPEAKATCTLDYVQRITGVTVNMPKLTSNEAAITYTTETSKYTIKSENKAKLANFQFNKTFDDKFCTAFDNANMFQSRPLCLPWQFDLSPNSTSSAFRINGCIYKNNGLEFRHGSEYITSDDLLNHTDGWGYGDGLNVTLFPEGLIGCIYAFDAQDCEDREGYIISAFRTAATQTYLGTVDVTVSSTYGGKTYSSVSKTVEIWVDGASLHILVTGLSLSDSFVII